MKIYTNYNFLGNEIQNVVMHPVENLPATGKAGQVCYLSAGETAGLYYHDGSAWVKLGDNADLAALIAEVNSALNEHVTEAGQTYATKDELTQHTEAAAAAYATKQEVADTYATKAYVGTLPEGTTATTVLAYIAEKYVAKEADKSLLADTEIERLLTLHNYDDTQVKADVKSNADAIDAIEADYVKAADIANFETKENVKKVSDELAGYKTSNDEALAKVKATADAAASKEYTDAELAKKADKSVVDAMYTNSKIDELIQSAKDYADSQNANTTYGIVYDSDAKEIKLVEGGTELVIDATAFIKDGMVSNVELNADNDLVITFNTDAGTEDIVVPLDKLIDVYSGFDGERVKVTVDGNTIKADLKTGTISKTYLDADVQASLNKADSALQSHQDISHLATKTEVENVDKKFENYTTTTNLNTLLADKADKTQVATDISTAKNEAITAAEEKVTALANGQVNTNKEAIATEKTRAEAAEAAIKTAIAGHAAEITKVNVTLSGATGTLTISEPNAFNIKAYDSDNVECIVAIKKVAGGYELTAYGLGADETLAIYYDTYSTISFAE